MKYKTINANKIGTVMSCENFDHYIHSTHHYFQYLFPK